eukprot:365103-Chlamydomonas_euryale.AAC.2
MHKYRLVAKKGEGTFSEVRDGVQCGAECGLQGGVEQSGTSRGGACTLGVEVVRGCGEGAGGREGRRGGMQETIHPHGGGAPCWPGAGPLSSWLPEQSGGTVVKTSQEGWKRLGRHLQRNLLVRKDSVPREGNEGEGGGRDVYCLLASSTERQTFHVKTPLDIRIRALTALSAPTTALTAAPTAAPTAAQVLKAQCIKNGKYVAIKRCAGCRRTTTSSSLSRCGKGGGAAESGGGKGKGGRAGEGKGALSLHHDHGHALVPMTQGVTSMPRGVEQAGSCCGVEGEAAKGRRGRGRKVGGAEAASVGQALQEQGETLKTCRPQSTKITLHTTTCVYGSSRVVCVSSLPVSRPRCPPRAFRSRVQVLYDQPTGRLALVFELMDMNIYELIRGRRHYVAEDRIKNYMYQLMKSMDHMHRNGIFHRCEVWGRKQGCGRPRTERHMARGRFSSDGWRGGHGGGEL